MGSKTHDTYHVCLYNPHMRSVERVVETFAGGLDAREEALGLAEQLSVLREQLSMLGVTFSAPYEIRVQQVRRGVAGGLYGAQRKRFLSGDSATPDPEEEERFWADDPEETVPRSIAAGEERMARAGASGVAE